MRVTSPTDRNTDGATRGIQTSPSMSVRPSPIRGRAETPRPALTSAQQVVKLGASNACHTDKAALELLAREIASAGTSFAPGTTGAGGRAGASPLIRQYAFLLGKSQVRPKVYLDGRALDLVDADSPPPPLRPAPDTTVAEAAPSTWREPANAVTVPLIRLAWARSGDKGNTSNIGVIARKPEWLELLRSQLTPDRVAQYLAHLVRGPVARYELPGIHAFNFVCENALDGGGMASLRNDALGKGMAQILLSMPVSVPAGTTGMSLALGASFPERTGGRA